MKYNLYILSTFFLVLFSCVQNVDDYDVAISNLENRVADLNNKIDDILFDINSLDSTINRYLLLQLSLSSDSSIIFNDGNEDIIIEEREISIIDPELFFKQHYTISSLSVLTCTLRNINKNQIERFYKKDTLEIINDSYVEQYVITEINKLNRYIKVKSINYNKEFTLYMDQE